MSDQAVEQEIGCAVAKVLCVRECGQSVECRAMEYTPEDATCRACWHAWAKGVLKGCTTSPPATR